MSGPKRNGFESFAEHLEGRFARGVRARWPEQEFESLARRAFAHQFASNPTYQAFCRTRNVTPHTVRGWWDVPAVPATAFRHLDLVSTDLPSSEASDGAVFRTSGTTAGRALRGRHLVPRLSLYRAALVPAFKAHLVPDLERIAFISLVPPPRELPDSSLSYMVGAAAKALATEAHWVVDGAGALDEARVRAAFGSLAEGTEPALLLGTALAFAHLLDRFGPAPPAPLPEGSRIMETGGFKGSGREVAAGPFRARLSAATGVPADRIVSEYGMTELLSQLYTPVLAEGVQSAGEHVAPPWMRVRALDPVTLAELAPGEEGLLAFFDLANLGSVCHVLTEDVGSVSGSRVRLSGRASGAEPRGCSRAMDELMTAAGSLR